MKEGRGEEGDEEEGDYSRLGSENNNGLLDDDAVCGGKERRGEEKSVDYVCVLIF